jgi:hypothetical protein
MQTGEELSTTRFLESKARDQISPVLQHLISAQFGSFDKHMNPIALLRRWLRFKGDTPLLSEEESESGALCWKRLGQYSRASERHDQGGRGACERMDKCVSRDRERWVDDPDQASKNIFGEAVDLFPRYALMFATVSCECKFPLSTVPSA